MAGRSMGGYAPSYSYGGYAPSYSYGGYAPTFSPYSGPGVVYGGCNGGGISGYGYFSAPPPVYGSYGGYGGYGYSAAPPPVYGSYGGYGGYPTFPRFAARAPRVIEIRAGLGIGRFARGGFRRY